jgi:hypothetical protein
MTRIIRRSTFVQKVLILSIIYLTVFNCKKSGDLSLRDRKQVVAYSVETFKAKNNGWGYNILAGEKIIIKQDIIPGIQKNTPFHSESDAKKVGLFVLEKVKKHQHPAVKIQELDSLKVTL